MALCRGSDAGPHQSRLLTMQGCISRASVDPGKGETQFPDLALQGGAVDAEQLGRLGAVVVTQGQDLTDVVGLLGDRHILRKAQLQGGGQGDKLGSEVITLAN